MHSHSKPNLPKTVAGDKSGASTSETKCDEPPAQEPDQLKDGEGAKDGEVPFLATFDNSYHRELALLPQDAWPQSAKHGRHSYTVKLCPSQLPAPMKPENEF